MKSCVARYFEGRPWSLLKEKAFLKSGCKKLLLRNCTLLWKVTKLSQTLANLTKQLVCTCYWVGVFGWKGRESNYSEPNIVSCVAQFPRESGGRGRGKRGMGEQGRTGRVRVRVRERKERQKGE
jgi:hypothetical protein